MTDPELARRRWAFLTFLRISGLAMMIVGAAVWKRGIFGFQDELVGQVLIVIGLIDALIAPAMFGRNWRSREDR